MWNIDCKQPDKIYLDDETIKNAIEKSTMSRRYYNLTAMLVRNFFRIKKNCHRLLEAARFCSFWITTHLPEQSTCLSRCVATLLSPATEDFIKKTWTFFSSPFNSTFYCANIYVVWTKNFARLKGVVLFRPRNICFVRWKMVIFIWTYKLQKKKKKTK